jgi:hypothetical protein
VHDLVFLNAMFFLERHFVKKLVAEVISSNSVN